MRRLCLILLFVPWLGGFSGTPEAAKKELTDAGIEYSEKNFLDRIRFGDVPTVKLFLASGMSPDAKEFLHTALTAASYYHQLTIVYLLLDAGANPDLWDYNTYTPLRNAVNGGDVPIARALLEGGAQVDLPDKHGITALMVAASGNARMVELLLEHGASIEQRWPRNFIAELNGFGWRSGYTPLLLAAEAGANPVVRVLLEKGADINALSDDGKTPLVAAACTNRLETVKLLLSPGMGFHAWRDDGAAALDCARQKLRTDRHNEVAKEIVQVLRDAGAKLRY